MQPHLDSLTVHAGKGAAGKILIVGGGPETGVVSIHLLHRRGLQLRQLDNHRPELARLGASLGTIEEREIFSASQVLDDANSSHGAIAIEQSVEHQHRILAVVHDMPKYDAHIGLARQIDQYATLGLGREGQNLVDALRTFEVHRPSVVRIVSQERSVRTIRIKSKEWQRTIDEILRAQTRHDRFADPALFAANEVNCAHARRMTEASPGSTSRRLLPNCPQTPDRKNTSDIHDGVSLLVPPQLPQPHSQSPTWIFTS